MTINDQSNAQQAFNAADHALPDRALQGVRTRRIFAFFLDLIYLTLIVSAIVAVLFILGLPTLGLSWFLIPPVLGLFPIVALVYNGVSISGWRRATPGMRHADLEVRMVDGNSVPFLNASAQAVLFYLAISFLTPFILLVSMVTTNKRCLHDMLASVVVTRRQG